MPSLSLSDRHISYVIERNARVRRVKIVVWEEGVKVVAPALVSETMIDRMLTQHASWIQKKLVRMETLMREQIVVRAHEDVRKQKKDALAFVHARLLVLNETYGFTYRTVRVKDQQTRWGSCSRKGNLNFNKRILSLPIHLADYIIVHELCHLKELNHSARFWRLVAQRIPDVRACRAQLRRYRIAS